MTVDTGYEIINAIINNPIEAIFLFGIVIVIRQLFFTRNGLFHDTVRHWKYDIERTLDDLFDWLEKKDRDMNAWLKSKTRKQILKYEILVISMIFIPVLIWNVTIPEKSLLNQVFFFVIIGEYVGLIAFLFYVYKKPKRKVITCSKHGEDLDIWGCEECNSKVRCEDCGIVHPDSSCAEAGNW